MSPLAEERQRGWALLGLLVTAFTTLLASTVSWPLTVAWALLAVSFLLDLAAPAREHLLHRIALAGRAFVFFVVLVLQWRCAAAAPL